MSVIDLDNALLADLVPYPEWMQEPNTWLLGRTPEETIHDGDEQRVREILIQAIVIGVS